MNIIRFEFHCDRKVDFYAHLCNQYLYEEALDISIGYEQGCYILEASGEQPKLESLADAIAADFLLSVWLRDTQIRLVKVRTTHRRLLPHDALSLPFCQQCLPQFGDNQAAHFGDVNYPCPCCHGEMRLGQPHQALTLNDLKTLTANLMEQGELWVADAGIKLSLKPFVNESMQERSQIVVCNPNNLNAHFSLVNHDVLALSSLEKPYILARPIGSHPSLTAPLYDICFAWNRTLVVITELLRQKGIDWVYCHTTTPRLKLTWINHAWASVEHSSPAQGHHFLYDLPSPHLVSSHYGEWNAHLRQTMSDEVIELTALHCAGYHQEHLLTSDPTLGAAHRALLAGLTTQSDKDKGTKHRNVHSAVLYFSHSHPSEIVTLDRESSLERFFAMPQLPDNGYDIYHQLESSPQKSLLEKFKQQYPDDYSRLLDLHLPQPTTNLKSLWAIAAIFLGLAPAGELHVNQLNDALISAAMSHHGANAPRIDYPLTKGEAWRSHRWQDAGIPT